MRIRTGPLFALVLAVLAAAVSTAAAAPPHAGSVDRSFGTNGRVDVALPGERMRPSALVVQPDGRIVVAGTLVDPGQYAYRGSAFAVRFTPDGELDASFGESGIARVASASLAIDGAGVQPDGAVLLTGTTPTEGGRDQAAVVRLLPSGRVDEGFGSGGIVRMPDASFSGYPRGVLRLSQVAVMPDGRIVAAGMQYPSDVHSASDPYVIRLMPDGSPDTSFDDDGRASMGAPNPIAVLARPNGEVVVVGWGARFFGGTDLTFLPIAPGANDFSFPAAPSNPSVSHQYRASMTAVAASLRPDGTIAVVGDLRGGPSRRHWLAWAVAGEDLQLLEQGKVAMHGVTAATFDARGAALTAGPWLTDVTTPPWRIERYRSMRRLDRSFGDRAGKRLVYIHSPSDVADPLRPTLTGLAMQGDKLIVAGYAHTGNDPREGRSLTVTRINARQDGSGPRVTVTGVPRRGCVSGATTLVVRARDESRVLTRVRIDRRRITSSRSHRFRVELDVNELNRGRHKLRIRAIDAAGNVGAAGRTIRVCG